ncbi:MAG TPA: signal peptide peptidase SppA [Bacteroidales bacterium]|nr:signal peptide peptidase SppA [Bacteroidales bacterium]
MKSFLKMTLATIVGLIFTGIIFFIIMLSALSAMVASGNKPVTIPDKSVLVINAGTAIPDRANENPFSSFDFATMSVKKTVGLNEILSDIRKAAEDQKIKGILLESGLQGSGWATSEEIRNALNEFRKSGKFVYAYADYLMTQQSYFVASSADKIWINPTGELDFKGLAAEVSFYHKALEKLGVEVQVIRHGKFKGAVEPFILDKMSEANRKQVKAYVGSIWNYAVATISKSRSIPERRLNEIADSLLAYDLSRASALGLIDGTLYRDQLNDSIRIKAGIEKDKKINFVSAAKYSKVVDSGHKSTSKDKIAIIYASGSIVTGNGDETNIGGGKFASEFAKVRKDSTIKAVVFRVNSPGGNAMAADIIWHEVDLTAQKKPVIVSMGNYAASGGYYVSAPATKILASPVTVTGSIGVFSLIPNLKPLLENKLGITSEVVGTNQYADFPSVTRPMDSYEKEVLQAGVEHIYSSFTGVVARGRKMEQAQVDSIGQGRVWSGSDALGIGLVDTVGGLSDAIREAAAAAGLKEYKVIDLPEKVDFATAFLSDLNDDIKMRALKDELGENAIFYLRIKEILEAGGIQARLPYFIDIH